MGTQVRLAWRNLWRNRRRSLLAASAIAFMTYLVVMVAALQYGTFGQMIDFATAQLHGHLQIQRADYFAEPGMRRNMPNATALAERLRQLPHVTAVARRAVGHFVISGEGEAQVARVLAVEPEQELALSTMPDAVTEGRYLSPGGAPEAVLGKELAKQLDVAVGDELVVMGSDSTGGAAFFLVEVVGIIELAQRELEATLMFVPLALFERELDFADRAHIVVARFESIEDSPAAVAALNAELADDLRAYGWDELIPDVVALMEMKLESQKIFFVILVIMVTMSIGNTFMMTIFERTQEFGVMMALGIKPRALIGMVQLEALFLCLLGVALGMVLASATVELLSRVGISMGEQMSDTLAQMSAPERLYPAHQWWFLPIVAGAMIGATQLAALIPSLRLRHLKPVEALRDEK